MDCRHYTTNLPERKRGQHLQREDRGAIQQMKRLGLSNRAIARELGCSPTTVGNELRRGTPPKKGRTGPMPSYSAKKGQAVYEANRRRCRKPRKQARCQTFVAWVVRQVREHRWSFDACVGYARLHGLFTAEEMVCTKTLYNELLSGGLALSLFEVPEVLKRRQRKAKSRTNKRLRGRSIEERPSIVAARVEPGHWEIDTVVGHRNGRESVVLSLIEKVTDNYLAIKIPGKNTDAVMAALQDLRAEYGDRFSAVFKTITADNGTEFDRLSEVESWGETMVYFTHPYSSWERPQNERHNGLLRAYIPKGVSVERYSPEEILSFADELNGRPRRILGYRTPEELFDAFLDQVYSA